MEWSQENEDKFYIYGGEQFGGFVLVNDLWEYDILTNAWTELSSSNGITPDAANYAVFAVTENDDFYVAFGETNDLSVECRTDTPINTAHSISGDTFKYDHDDKYNKWEKQEFNVFSPRLKRPAYTYNSRRENKQNIYVYG